jgi:hypothetical protein
MANTRASQINGRLIEKRNMQAPHCCSNWSDRPCLFDTDEAARSAAQCFEYHRRLKVAGTLCCIVANLMTYVRSRWMRKNTDSCCRCEYTKPPVRYEHKCQIYIDFTMHMHIPTYMAIVAAFVHTNTMSWWSELCQLTADATAEEQQRWNRGQLNKLNAK